MSLSFRRRDRGGNVHHYFIPFDPLALIVLAGILFGFGFTLLLSFRDLAHREPLQVAFAILTMLIVGFSLFAIAKWSIIRTGTLTSFGPKPMNAMMRRLYFCGYAVMSCAVLLALVLTA